MGYDPQIFTVTINAPGIDYSDEIVLAALRRAFFTGRYDDPHSITVVENAGVPTDAEVDHLTYTVGDEDGGVGLFCKICDHGGQPIAYLASGDESVWADDSGVVNATTLSELVKAGRDHGYTHTP